MCTYVCMYMCVYVCVYMCVAVTLNWRTRRTASSKIKCIIKKIYSTQNTLCNVCNKQVENILYNTIQEILFDECFSVLTFFYYNTTAISAAVID